LIKDGFVNPAFNEDKNGYKYRVSSNNDGVQVYADPIEGAEKSNHFMIDPWGNMRVELGRPATGKSALVKLQGGLKGLKMPTSHTPPVPPAPDQAEDNPEQWQSN